MKLTPQISVTLGNQSKARTNDTTTAFKEVDWDVVAGKAAIVQQTSVDIAKVVAIAYGAKKLIDTVCEIAVIAAQRHI